MKNFTKSTVLGNWLRTPLTLLGMLVVFCAYSQNPFITTWKTDNPGTSNSTSITIPTHPDFPYNYEVDWDDDGTFDQTGITGNVTHDFGTAGTKIIRIRGTFPSIFFNETGDRQKILDVSQWGDIAWTSMGQSFAGCSNLNISATDVPNLAAVSSMFQMFKDCSSLNGPANIGTWNTGSVRNMEKVFFGASIFNQPIGNWNTAMVNNMTGMFRDATAFDQPIGNWNTGEVTSMFGIFAGASNFNQPIGNWNVAKVKNMNSLFENALLFNQPIGNWNTAEATDMGAMFRNASAFNQPIGNWNVAKVMSMDAMFRQAILFNQPIGNWNTAMVASMNAMFRDAAAFNQNIGAWTLNPSVDLTLMLDDCGMDCANYSATLIGWNANPLTPDARSLGANGRTYETATVTARTNLTATKGWTINGDAIISTIFYADADSDGSGNPAVSQNACTAPNGYVANSMDCNDGNASAFPGGTEICDGVDNDCNGTIDDVAACGSAGTRTWTGFVSTDWHTPCNWNPGCVPTADDDVIIPNVANDPTISAAAVAQSVVVNTDGVLTVAASGSLTLNGSTAFEGATTAFGNNGTVHNNGILTIGSTTSPGLYGLHNRSVFNNNMDGQINIDRPNFIGLYNQEGTFNNAATITIGATPVAISMDQGLWNESTFNNICHSEGNCGQITIDRTSDAGLNNSIGGIFTNAATITIGAVESVGKHGVKNYTTFDNNSGGQINIDRTSDAGLFNQSGTFNNAATITIGANASVGFYGLHNRSVFNNNMDGQINIDRPNFIGLYNQEGTFNNSATITIGATPVAISMDQGLWNESTFNNICHSEGNCGQITIDRTSDAGLNNSTGGIFTNAATITIGAVESVGNYGVKNYTMFNNNACAEITTFYPLFNSSSFTNAGLLRVNTASAHTNSALTNNGIIEYAQDNPIPNVVNNEITIAPMTANNCDVISPAFGLGSPVDFTIVGIFTDAAATMSAGTYTTATNTFIPTSVLAEGTYTFYVKIEDGDGGCTRIATWQLTTEDCCDAPVAICKTAAIVLVGNSASLDVWAVNNGSTYDCGLQSMTVSPNTFSCSQIGTPQSVTLTVTDTKGHSDDCQTTVTIQDNSAPSIVCPLNITRTTDANQCTAIVTYNAPTFSDNCGGAYLIRTGGPASGGVFPKGTTLVNWVATDASGNSAICGFTVTVTDGQAPTITCPANLVKGTDAGQCTAVVTYTNPVFTDNCTGASVALFSGLASGSTFQKGGNTVVWKVTDGAGLAATCAFTVTVNDNQAPVITCPGNQTKNTGAGLCTAVATYPTPTFTDNCAGGSVTIQSGLATGSAFPKGLNTVVWRATDAAGLTKICTFRVTVNDAQAPTITCPANQAKTTDAGQCTAVATYNLATFTDNCAGGSVVKLSGLNSGTAFPRGVNNVVFRATDASGNQSLCTLTITVTDAQLPTVACPANIAVTGSTANGICSATVTYTNPTASDNCGLQSSYLLNGLASGSVFPVGVTTNVWKATDEGGLTATCAFTVTVSCGTAPGTMNDERGTMNKGNAAQSLSPASRTDLTTLSRPVSGSNLDMRLAPNPATTEVQITLEGLTENSGQLTVFDAQGRVVWQQSSVLSPTTSIPVGDWPSGLYFVTWKHEGRTVTKKLAVERL